MIEEAHLEELGLHVTGRSANGGEIGAHCPFCDDGKPNNFSVNAETGKWHCFKCGEGGAFLSLAEGLGRPVPAGLLGPQNVWAQPPTPLSAKGQAVLNETADFFHQNLDQKAAAYLAGRGLSRATIERFKIGVAKVGLGYHLQIRKEYDELACLEAGVLTPRDDRGRLGMYCRGAIAFPVFAPEGNVETILYRIPDDRLRSGGLRYIALRGRPRGLINRSAAAGVDEMWLAEGIMDTLTLDGLGLPAVGLPSASTVKSEFAKTLAGKRRVLVVMDNDEAGEKARETVRRKLPGIPFVDVHLPEGVKDVNELVVKHGATRAMFEALAADATKNLPATLAAVSSAAAATNVDGVRGFDFGQLHYDVRDAHLGRNGDVVATISASRHGEEVEHDMLSLTRRRSREGFADACATPEVAEHLRSIARELGTELRRQARGNSPCALNQGARFDVEPVRINPAQGFDGQHVYVTVSMLETRESKGEAYHARVTCLVRSDGSLMKVRSPDDVGDSSAQWSVIGTNLLLDRGVEMGSPRWGNFGKTHDVAWYLRYASTWWQAPSSISLPAMVFDRVRHQFIHHIYFRDPRKYVVCALYVMLSYFQELFEALPYIWLHGRKGSGKTTAGKLFECKSSPVPVLT